MNVDHEAPGPITLNALIGELAGRSLRPGERIELPPVVLGVFEATSITWPSGSTIGNTNTCGTTPTTSGTR